MLEFVVVWLLAGYVGGIARDRGHKPTGYKWMTVGLWVGGEVSGPSSARRSRAISS